jgi:hypothetical protein
MLLALCGLLCVGVFSCASSGGGSGGSDVFYGEWEWEAAADDGEGGNSTANLVVAEETIGGETVTTYTWSGAVNGQAEWPWASCYVKPADDATLAKLQSASAISFKVIATKIPQGLVYLQAAIPAVTDYGYHRRNFFNSLKIGETVELTFQVRTFTQPGWAAPKRFDITGVDELQFGAAGDNAYQGIGEYEFKIWDFKLIM